MSSSCIDDRLLEKYGNQSICRVVEVIHTNDLNKFGTICCAISNVVQTQIGSEFHAQNTRETHVCK